MARMARAPGRTEHVTAQRLFEAERPPLLVALRERYGGTPTVSPLLPPCPTPPTTRSSASTALTDHRTRERFTMAA